MTYDDAFLQAILENPDDDAPRLIYADWLEERGDPRGEFICIQCQLAAMSAKDERIPLLERQESELLVRHQDTWLGTMRPLLSGWAFRRGFLHALTVPAATYLQHAPFPRPATVRWVKVDLNGFEIPQAILELVPESVARENILISIGIRRRRLVMASPYAHDAEMLAKMQFILNRGIELVAADREQVIEAMDRFYGNSETESVDSILYEFVDTAIDFEPELADDDLPVAKLVTLIIQEAQAMRAEQIRIQPRPENTQVFYRIDQKWVERDHPPRRLLGPIVSLIRRRADLASSDEGAPQTGHLRGTTNGMPVQLRVHIRPTEDGPMVILRFLPAEKVKPV